MNNKNERDEELTIQSKAFNAFEDGLLPSDLVKNEICTISEAKEMYERYLEFQDYETPEDLMTAKLLTQIGLLGSRLARVEIKLLNSLLLPKSYQCKGCDHKGVFGVGVVCQRCGKVDVYTPSEINEDILKNIPISGFRPWEKED
ncbi:MAG: hypothetical protein R6U17_04565 [Thermoplasmata archaeon]